MAIQEFFLRNDVSNKFWTVETVGVEVFTSSGRIGADARTASQTFADETAAVTWMQRRIAKKLEKGYRAGAIADLDQWQAPDWSTMTMDEDVFWRIIALFSWTKGSDDGDKVMHRAVAALTAMPVEQIYRFTDILAERLYALDTREHCRYAYLGEVDPDDGNDYISADDFLYRRCYLVANGQAYYDTVLADPTKISTEEEFEDLLGLADRAYEEKTGEDYEYDAAVSYESFANDQGWASGETPASGWATGEDVPVRNRRPT